MNRFSLLATAAVLTAGLATPVASAAPRGFTAEDLVSLDRISEPALSPDGKRVVYTLRETDRAANRGRTDLWLLDLDRTGARPQRLTSHEANDTSPQWSADGSAIYFLSARSGGTQVWRLAASGGEAIPVTRLPVDVDSFRVAAKGDRLVFSTEAYPDCADLACTKKASDAAAAQKASGRVYDRLFVRHWDTWNNGTIQRLWSIALDANGQASGAEVSLSGSLDADVHSKPFGGADDYTLSPDGTRVVFAARIKGKSEPWSTNFDLYEVPMTGGTPVNLTAANPAWDGSPKFSPDGSKLAYVAMERPGFEADRFHLVLRDVAKGSVGFTTRDWDSSIGEYDWSPDGKRIYAATDHIGQHPLWAIDLPSGKRSMLTGQGSVTAIAVGRERVVYALQHLASAAELYSVPARGGKPAQLTSVNAGKLADVRFGEAEQYSFAGAGGEKVYGYVMKPWNYTPGKKYPIAFIVHGGPQSSFANNWSFRWNPQVYAGAGYGVIFIDFHGSPGYGQAFTDSISGDWGGKPVEDLKLGLAAALERNPWLDGSRNCALGASYGGFMMNWIAGNWAEPFRCIVSHAGIFDAQMMYYTTEELWFDEWDHGGAPYYANPAAYEKFSPARQVAKWRTPMLVIHGERDYRVPYSQGLAVFTALQRQGVESRFLVFPDENHWILKPANSLQWHSEVLGWLDAHTKP